MSAGGEKRVKAEQLERKDGEVVVVEEELRRRRLDAKWKAGWDRLGESERRRPCGQFVADHQTKVRW